MKAALLLFSLCVFTWAPKAGAQKIKTPSQVKRCSEGVAHACYDYGMTLILSSKSELKEEGERYIRRACTLAYAPACRRRRMLERGLGAADPLAIARCISDDMVKSTRLNPARGGQVIDTMEKGSSFERAGFQIGDVIKSINGLPASSPEQIERALNDGEASNAKVVVERNGESIPLLLPCSSAP